MSVTQPIRVQGSIVEILGDGVWPQMAEEIRDNLVSPFFDVDWVQHDMSLVNGRDATDDQVLDNVIADLVKHKAGVKGPTITPSIDEAKELGLKKRWPSPNGAIRRGIAGAAIFRSPIDIEGMEKNAPPMEGVSIARCPVGDIYGAPEWDIPNAGTLQITFTDAVTGETIKVAAKEITGPGVGRLTTETDESIRNYAKAVFEQAIAMDKPVVLGTKNTINPEYDGRFLNIFQQTYDEYFKDYFEGRGLGFEHMLIDAVATKIVNGGLNNTLVALKNYDGDVLSDEVAGAHISLGMMDSSLVSADGTMMTDPPHGTAPDLEQEFWKNGKLLANPSAYVFAYAEILAHKGRINSQPEVVQRAGVLKDATVAAIQAGFKTGDLTKGEETPVTAQDFIQEIKRNVLLTLSSQPAFEQDNNAGLTGGTQLG